MTVVDCSGDLIRMALAEDLGERGDVTSLTTLASGTRAKARILARAEGVLAGLPLVTQVFSEMDRGVQVRLIKGDGERVTAGELLCEVEGRAATLLGAERTALNFLQRMSGIATITAAYVAAVAGTGARILDTRKTAPGLRMLDKYAVVAGGGANHRMGLHDMVLLKDNHIEAADGIGPAVAAVKSAMARDRRRVKIEVEVKTLRELEDALVAGADRVMLDNMDLHTTGLAVARARSFGPEGLLLEASGNVTLKTVRTVAETGVDLISVGALTHSPPSLDLSLLFQ